eukprot:SAG31_NODE_192_length_20788_cov_8.938083_3_plen_93_part_00
MPATVEMTAFRVPDETKQQHCKDVFAMHRALEHSTERVSIMFHAECNGQLSHAFSCANRNPQTPTEPTASIFTAFGPFAVRCCWALSVVTES